MSWRNARRHKFAWRGSIVLHLAHFSPTFSRETWMVISLAHDLPLMMYTHLIRLARAPSHVHICARVGLLSLWHSLEMFLKVAFTIKLVTTNEPQHHKTNKMSVRPAKTQIRPVWSESSLSAWRNLGSLATYWAHSQDSVQTGRLPRLIWCLAGCTVTLLVLTCRG